MIKYLTDSKILVISHKSDIDGMGPVILAQVSFNENVSYILVDPQELSAVIKYILDNNLYENYDYIYITDLPIRKDTISLISGSALKDTLLAFDHHKTDVQANEYSWANVYPEKDGIKACGTTLFYDYLLSTFNPAILCTNQVKEFIEAIRLNDNYGVLAPNNKLGNDLENILSDGHPFTFISMFTKHLRFPDEHFHFTRQEQHIADSIQNEIDSYVHSCEVDMKIINFDDHKAGFVISNKYRNSVGALIAQRHDELDFILIQDNERKSYSIRAVKDVGVGYICKKFCGGGQAKAGGFPMNDSTLEYVIKCLRD